MTLTSNGSLVKNRVKNSAPARPITIPIAATAIPWPDTIRTMAVGSAPSAMRIAISRVRSATTYAITLYNPIAPRIKAIADAHPTTNSVKLRRAVARDDVRQAADSVQRQRRIERGTVIAANVPASAIAAAPAAMSDAAERELDGCLAASQPRDRLVVERRPFRFRRVQAQRHPQLGVGRRKPRGRHDADHVVALAVDVDARSKQRNVTA
jgi:hypothetical protein